MGNDNSGISLYHFDKKNTSLARLWDRVRAIREKPASVQSFFRSSNLLLFLSFGHSCIQLLIIPSIHHPFIHLAIHHQSTPLIHSPFVQPGFNPSFSSLIQPSISLCIHHPEEVVAAAKARLPSPLPGHPSVALSLIMTFLTTLFWRSGRGRLCCGCLGFLVFCFVLFFVDIRFFPFF